MKKQIIIIGIILLMMTIVSAADLTDELTDWYKSAGDEKLADSVKSAELDILLDSKDTATDTGIDKYSGVSLDWIENGINQKCLGIEISKGIKESVPINIIIGDADFNAKQISSVTLFKRESDEVLIPIYNSSESSIKESNGSTTRVYSDSIIGYDTKTVFDWAEIKKSGSESYYSTYSDRIDELSISEDGYYKACFDVPNRNSNTIGSAGAVYVEIDGEMYADFQHSSWWNETFLYRKPVEITNNYGSALLKYYTIELSGWDTTGAEFNASIPYNFELVCDGDAVDKVIGNTTEILRAPAIPYYGSATGWKTANTTILFRLNTEIPASSSNNTLCYIYYGDMDYQSLLTNKSNIALFYDDFNRGDNAAVGNGWVEDEVANGFAISSNQLMASVNNPISWRALDIGSCADCGKYEIIYESGINGASAGGGIVVSVTNITDTSVLDDAGGDFLGSDKFNLNIDESSDVISIAHGISQINTGTAIKTNPLIDSDTDFVGRFIVLDSESRGDYIGWKNGTDYIPWSTTNITGEGNGNTRAIVQVWANRQNNQINFIYIKRWVDISPSVSLGSEEEPEVPVPVYVNITYPLNGTNITLLDVDDIMFLFNISRIAVCSISYDSYEYNQSYNPVMNQRELSLGIINKSITINVTCLDNQSLYGSDAVTFDYYFTESPSGVLEAGECPGSELGIMTFGLAIAFIFGLIIINKLYIRILVIDMIIALGIVFIGFVFLGCSVVIGAVGLAFGLIYLTASIFMRV